MVIKKLFAKIVIVLRSYMTEIMISYFFTFFLDTSQLQNVYLRFTTLKFSKHD